MGIEHFIITRFCIRDPGLFKHSKGQEWYSGRDPLASEYLTKRLGLMELICAPALAAQSNQDFKWIILIDPALPNDKRERLLEITKEVSNVLLHQVDVIERLDRTKWLRPYCPEKIEILITTMLDDDDGLPKDFVDAIQKAVLSGIHKNTIPPIILFGVDGIKQWNLQYDSSNPFGTQSAWQNPNSQISSCGFSLAVQNSIFPLTIMGLRHSAAHNYLDFSKIPQTPNVEYFRGQVTELSLKNKVDLSKYVSDSFFQDLFPICGSVVVTNHPSNDEVNRIYQEKIDETSIDAYVNFPNVGINWFGAEELIKSIGIDNQTFGKRKRLNSVMKYYYKIRRNIVKRLQ